MGSRGRIYKMSPDPPWEGTILRRKGAHCKVYTDYRSCAAAMRPFRQIISTTSLLMLHTLKSSRRIFYHMKNSSFGIYLFGVYFGCFWTCRICIWLRHVCAVLHRSASVYFLFVSFALALILLLLLSRLVWHSLKSAIERIQSLADISRSALHVFAAYKAISLHTCKLTRCNQIS